VPRAPRRRAAAAARTPGAIVTPLHWQYGLPRRVPPPAQRAELRRVAKVVSSFDSAVELAPNCGGRSQLDDAEQPRRRASAAAGTPRRRERRWRLPGGTISAGGVDPACSATSTTRQTAAPGPPDTFARRAANRSWARSLAPHRAAGPPGRRAASVPLPAARFLRQQRRYSKSLWRRKFTADPSVVGSRMVQPAFILRNFTVLAWPSVMR
jgi:hypothetical protein